MLIAQTSLEELKGLRAEWTQELDRINKLMKPTRPLSARQQRFQKDQAIILRNVIALNLQIQNYR